MNTDYKPVSSAARQAWIDGEDDPKVLKGIDLEEAAYQAYDAGFGHQAAGEGHLVTEALKAVADHNGETVGDVIARIHARWVRR